MAAQLCGTFKDEFVTSLAALALYDGDAEISAENINNLLKASNNVGVKPYWPVLISSILKGGKIESIIFSGGVAGGGNSTMAVTTSTTAAGG
jgi:ribosomal protein L12E/L44/L45/RPP1/RPP2